MSEDYILVTNWEIVDKDGFYLQKDWIKNCNYSDFKEAKDLLFYGYIAPALSYILYHTLNASQILIDSNYRILIQCESVVIENKHINKIEYNY